MHWKIHRGRFAMPCCALLVVFLSVACVFCHDNHPSSSDTFTEDLYISPLPTGHVYLHVKFAVTTPFKEKYSHTDLFPKSVIDIIQRHNVDELHVRLTQGHFRHYQWGYPHVPSPTGGEVWAWFKKGVDVDRKWQALTSSLAGLFCASFNQIKPANSISPRFAFKPQGLSNNESRAEAYQLRYTILPKENPCTENLTPWKKLLPCYHAAGLSRALNAVKLISSNFFALSLDVQTVCGDEKCTQKRLELIMGATAVIRPASVQDSGKFDWSLRDLLEINLDSGCPLASSSLIHVDRCLKNQMVFWPDPHLLNADVALYDLKNVSSTGSPLQLGGKSATKLQYLSTRPRLTIHRFTGGSGQQSGSIRSVIVNNDAENDVKVLYLEMIPWFLRVYVHTVKVRLGGYELPLLKKDIVLALDRQKPLKIELVFEIPRNSTVEFSVEFDYTLLKWTEYPPDANHGFEIPSSVLMAKLPSCTDSIFPNDDPSCFVRLYAEALLVNIPTPDFSMPYNVICLTCTVLALAFGPIHALTTKKLVPLDSKQSASPLMRLKHKVVEIWNARRKKKSE